MKWRCLVAAVLSLAILSPAIALGPDEVLSDAALEARARALSKELRCMVCQNQSIDDSDAPLARDLRLLVRERLEAGESDQQILDFLVGRYGEFVLLKPRFSGHTALLWSWPIGVVLIAGAGLALAGRRYRQRTAAQLATAQVATLTPAEQGRLAEILKSPPA